MTQPARGMRVVLDLRPLQEPDRGPTTAAYLESLLAAYAAEPLAGESFTFVLQAGLPDPSEELEGLDRIDVAGRRRLPPTSLLRSGALAVDPFLLRAASLGASLRAGSRGAAGAVYHAAGGAVPIASRLPLVVTLLDLAPWELPAAFQRTPTSRFGQRLRGRTLQRATAVIVPSLAAATATRRLLHIRRDRLRVVPLAPRLPGLGEGAASAATERARRGVPDRYFVYTGRYDARQDLATLLDALRIVAVESPPGGNGAAWPPHVLLLGATTDDRAAVGRAAARDGVGEMLSYVPHLEPATVAGLVAGARAVLIPALSDTAGMGAIDALGLGTPVVASAVGALPEVVGNAGILVEPRDPLRLAAALRAAWSDDALHGRLVTAARRATVRRTWSEVAAETRGIYDEVGRART